MGVPIGTIGPRSHVPTRFGELLREVRVRTQVSQTQVAEMAGCSGGYIGLLESGARGQRPRLDLVLRIAQAAKATVPETEALMRAAGHLGEYEPLIPEDRPTTEQVIAMDPRLSRDQKAALITHYHAYVGS